MCVGDPKTLNSAGVPPDVVAQSPAALKAMTEVAGKQLPSGGNSPMKKGK